MWADQQYYEVLGTRFKVRATDEAVATDLRGLLEPFDYGQRTGVRGRHTYSVVDDGSTVIAYRDCVPIGGSRRAEDIFSIVLASLNRIAIEECAHFATHAAVVGVGASAVAIPGDAGIGKTTLAAACLQSGFAYVSDEALVVASSRDVIPYPKPLGLSDWSREHTGIEDDVGVRGDGETFVPASEIAAVAEGPLRLGHVVLAEYGHANAAVEELPASDAMTALLGNSFNHYKHGRAAFELAAALSADARVWRLEYGDPMEAAGLLATTISG